MKPLEQTLTNKQQKHNKRKHKQNLRQPLQKTCKKTFNHSKTINKQLKT